MALCESVPAWRGCVPRALLTQPPENVNVGRSFLISLLFFILPLPAPSSSRTLSLSFCPTSRDSINPIWKWYLPLIIFIKYLLHIHGLGMPYTVKAIKHKLNILNIHNFLWFSKNRERWREDRRETKRRGGRRKEYSICSEYFIWVNIVIRFKCLIILSSLL